MLGLIKQVKIADETMRVVLKLVRATHPDADEAPAEIKQYVRYGASPRAAQSIILAAKTLALIAGRYSVAVDDVRQVAVPALNHRLILNFHGEMERVTAASLVERLVSAIGTA
jgi:MoxR-like ATPase